MTYPPNGPTTVADVKELSRVTGTADDVRLGRIVAAVNAWVLRLPSAAVADGVADWTAPGVQHIVEGATMLGARLYRRKNTPDGVVSMGGESFAYIARNDPDVAMLLGLGTWAPPAVG
jgi:hypothetical protein